MSTEDPKDRFLRLPEVQNRTGFSRSYIYKAVKENAFPAPYKAGRATVWTESQILDWMSLITGKNLIEKRSPDE